MTFKEFLEQKSYHLPYTDQDLVDAYNFAKEELSNNIKVNITSLSDGYVVHEVVLISQLKKQGILNE